ncbi:MAG: hypothetical protein SWY16_22140 [Cyanobacteriota bacterium]|nr:hypothetical protein [Cyanobacteriota bacterium]
MAKITITVIVTLAATKFIEGVGGDSASGLLLRRSIKMSELWRAIIRTVPGQEAERRNSYRANRMRQ